MQQELIRGTATGEYPAFETHDSGCDSRGAAGVRAGWCPGGVRGVSRRQQELHWHLPGLRFAAGVRRGVREVSRVRVQ